MNESNVKRFIKVMTREGYKVKENDYNGYFLTKFIGDDEKRQYGIAVSKELIESAPHKVISYIREEFDEFKVKANE